MYSEHMGAYHKNRTDIIWHEKEELALIIRPTACTEKYTFPARKTDTLQIGVMNILKGDGAEPHEHTQAKKVDKTPCEIFYVIKGKVEFTLFNKAREEVKKVIVEEGECIFVRCGHSTKFLEDSKILEVTEGAYRGKEKEKVFFKE